MAPAYNRGSVPWEFTMVESGNNTNCLVTDDPHGTRRPYTGGADRRTHNSKTKWSNYVNCDNDI